MKQSIFPSCECGGKPFTIRHIKLDNAICRIAPESLWKQIQVENNEEGWRIDETIFFYAPDEMINANYRALKKYVQENV